MEGYAVDGLAASGEAVLAGLGPLVVRVAVMYEGAAGAVLLDDMERLAVEESRKIGLGARQLAMDAQADAEMPLPGLTGQDGERRGCRERSATTVVTMLGRVRVHRIAYRSRKKGVADLHWRDAVLNLPPCGHSWQLQRFAEMACRSGSFQDGHEIVLAATGVSIGKRQLEEIVAAAAGAEEFARDRPGAGRARLAGPRRGRRRAGRRAGDVRGRQGRVDAAGRPPETAARPRNGTGTGQTGRERGEDRRRSGWPRPAPCSTPCPRSSPAPRRTSCSARARQQPQSTPQALNKWYTCDITAGRDVTVGKIFDRGRPPRPRSPAGLDRAGGRGQPPARPDPGRRGRPRGIHAVRGAVGDVGYWGGVAEA